MHPGETAGATAYDPHPERLKNPIRIWHPGPEWPYEPTQGAGCWWRAGGWRSCPTNPENVSSKSPTPQRATRLTAKAPRDAPTAGKEWHRIQTPDRQPLTRLLSQLVDAGWLIRLERGKFCLVPLEVESAEQYVGNELLIASRLAEPCYLSYWTALRYYELTEQISRTVYVVTTKRKHSTRRVIQGLQYRVVTVPEYKFFGFSPVWIGSDQVYLADREKTVIDGLDSPRYTGGLIEIAKAISTLKDLMNWDRVLAYAARMRNGAIPKRLGFLLELYDIRPDVQYKLHLHITKGVSPLDPTAGPEGPIDTYWNLRMNLSRAELLEWRAT